MKYLNSVCFIRNAPLGKRGEFGNGELEASPELLENISRENVQGELGFGRKGRKEWCEGAARGRSRELQGRRGKEGEDGIWDEDEGQGAVGKEGMKREKVCVG